MIRRQLCLWGMIVLIAGSWRAVAADKTQPRPVDRRGTNVGRDPASTVSSDAKIQCKRSARGEAQTAGRGAAERKREFNHKLTASAPVGAVRNPAEPPSNDSCDLPETVAFDLPDDVTGTFDFDNFEATEDGLDHAACIDPDVDPVGKIIHDLWYCWTATCTGPVEVATCDLTDVDTKIAVYEGCDICPPSDDQLVHFGCNDDVSATCGFQSTVSFMAQSGQSYMIRIGTYPGDESIELPPADGGSGQFRITCSDVSCQDGASIDTCQPFHRFDGTLSDRDQYRVADDFTPTASGEISELCWWGGYLPDQAGWDSFEVRFYADAEGLPDEVNLIGGPFRQEDGTLVVSPAIDTAAGVDFHVFEYTAVIPGACTISQSPCSASDQDCRQACELSLEDCDSDFDCRFIENDACTLVQSCESRAVSVTAGECYWLEIVNTFTSYIAWYWQDGVGGDISALADEFVATPPSVYEETERLVNDQAFCLNVPTQSCQGSPCDGATESCCEPHGPPGCEDPDCCKMVCACDSFCCTSGNNWDGVCAGDGYEGNGCGAAILCAQYCAGCPDDPAAIQWLDPGGVPLSPAGVIDARQPHLIDDALVSQGWDTFVAEAPIGAGTACWSAPECDSNGARVGPNVDYVIDHGDGTHTIKLERPITPGALTQLTYTTDLGVAYTGNYALLPADADGNGEAGVDDIDDLISCLNGLPCEEWEKDINRSVLANSRDLLRLIDLLNGAGDFEVWLGRTVPSNCP